MSKFAVGEIAIHKGSDEGSWKAGELCVIEKVNELETDGLIYLIVDMSGEYEAYADDSDLLKLPPDDATDRRTEDPGLTRLKRALEQDMQQDTRKAPGRVKA